MNYLWTTINVKDLEKSIKFYQDIVGLKIKKKFKAGSKKTIAFLESLENQTEIELIEDQAKSEFNLGTDISLGFEINSIKEKIKLLKEKKINIESGPISPQPDIEFFYVLDPNGIRIQFVENK